MASPLSCDDAEIPELIAIAVDRQASAGNLPGEIEATVVDVEPVSYTHLDVYKRQP